jgi:hypothetical protein
MAKTKPTSRTKTKKFLRNSGTQHHYTNTGYTVKFGKYRGQLLQTLPREYIEWAVSEISDAELLLKFRAELAWRDWLGAKKNTNEKAQQKTA